MKRFLGSFMKYGKFALLISACALTVTACSDNDSSSNGTGNRADLGNVTLENYFDFSTQQKVAVNVHYNVPAGYNVNFKVYAENPFETINGQETLRSGLTEVSVGTTDADGNYVHTDVLPAGLSKVYIYSDQLGVPRLFAATISGGKLTAKIDFATAEASLSSSSANAKKYTVKGNHPFTDYFPKSQTLGSSDAKGVPQYVASTTTFDANVLSTFNSTLPEGGWNKDYAKYITDNGDIELLEAASLVEFTYLGGTTGARSTLAYYCYPKGASADVIKTAVSHCCVIFQNANSSVLNSGMTIKLYYIDADGNMQINGHFPENTEIGFVLYNNGFVGGNGLGTKDIFYSTKSLNYDGISHMAALGITDAHATNHNVLSFEDWVGSALDYNDVAFTISSNPESAIIVTPVPNPEKETFTTQNFKGLLCFEDNWPNKGDFDMNDVVVKYNTVQTINKDNKVVKTVDTYTLLWSGANITNGFGFSMDNVVRSNATSVITDAEGNVVNVTNPFAGLSKQVVLLTDNVKKELGVDGVTVQNMKAEMVTPKTFVVTTTFKTPVDKSLIVPPYNPFTVKARGYEVHLPNFAPTGFVAQPFNTGDDISDGISSFYISSHNYPFALHMDARADASMLDFNYKQESKAVDTFYPKFANWATTHDATIKWWVKD